MKGELIFSKLIEIGRSEAFYLKKGGIRENRQFARERGVTILY